MAARRPFWKRHCWKSIGFCLWPPSTCIWSLKSKSQSKLPDLCSGNHVVYRQTDGRTDGQTDRRTRWIQYTPPPTSLGGGIINDPPLSEPKVTFSTYICITWPDALCYLHLQCTTVITWENFKQKMLIVGTRYLWKQGLGMLYVGFVW